MHLKQSLAIVATMASAPAVAFSPSDPSSGAATAQDATLRPMALNYKNYHSSYYEYVDVDGDRMSLLSLLDPISTIPPEVTKESPSTTSSPGRTSPTSAKTKSSKAAERASPVTQLHTIQDYHRHVLNEPNQLCVIRFSAPWCKVCKATNVAWERMASKIHKKMSNNDVSCSYDSSSNNCKQIKFLSVNLDGDEAAIALKDMLQVTRVPQGILHHPTQGVFGQKVDLNRSSLSKLKKQLERYSSEDGMESGMVLDGLPVGV